MIICIAFFLHFAFAATSSLTNSIHRTQAANEKVNNLACYSCDTMTDGKVCAEMDANNKTLKESVATVKCEPDELVCMVRRFDYTTSTENSTSDHKLWNLIRSCSKKCEPGCIIIGERTKIYSCFSCCDKPLCNTGKGEGPKTVLPNFMLIFLSVFDYVSGIFLCSGAS
uniref:Snake toxin/toxin-like domain-containing protein n=1 Tax=Megaselia scalaris TaxID=36166 RepID=T1GSV7_MEGSC